VRDRAGGRAARRADAEAEFGRHAAETGSVLVRRNQRVRAGQMVGRVGNAGASGAPHLHLQISGRPSPLEANGLPFVFRGFGVTGTVTNLDEFLSGTARATVRAEPPARRRRSGQYPLQATVLDFRGGRRASGGSP